MHDGVCKHCGTSIGSLPFEVGQPVYDPHLVPVGAVISAGGGCGSVTVTGKDTEYLHTTVCEHGENKIRLGCAAFRCGDVFLEALP